MSQIFYNRNTRHEGVQWYQVNVRILINKKVINSKINRNFKTFFCLKTQYAICIGIEIL